MSLTIRDKNFLENINHERLLLSSTFTFNVFSERTIVSINRARRF